MDFDKIEICTCKYKLESFKIQIPGMELYNVDKGQITNMILEKEFDTHMFPYFEVTLQVSNKVLRAMRKNFADCHAIVSMKYALIKNKVGGKVSNEEPVWQNYFNKKFMIFMDKGSPDLQETHVEQYESDNNFKNDTITTQDFGVLQIALYAEDYLMNTKKIINKILTSPTLTDVVAYVCNTAGIGRILMTPVNNNTVPKPYILYPVTALEHIVNLMDRYAAHSTGSVIFFDILRGYIIDKKPECTAWEPNEYKVTYLISKSDNNKEAGTLEGCYIDSRNKCNIVNINPSNIEINNASYMNDQLKGNNVTLIDSQTGNIQQIGSGGKGKISGSSNYVYDGMGNGQTSSVLKHELEEANAIGTIALHGVHIGVLDPNLQYILNINNSKYKKYNGNYRITSQKTTFQRDGEYYVPNTIITIKGNRG